MAENRPRTRPGGDPGGSKRCAKPRVVAIVQARTGSTRLPGKVLEDLCGLPVLSHVLNRVAATRGLDEVAVATTDLERDDRLAEVAKRHGAPCFRGSEADVLSRYYGAAHAFEADRIIRVTADCPLFDPLLLSKMIERWFELESGGVDIEYLSNFHPRTYPKGLDAEIMTREALDRAHREAIETYDREHVTPWLYRLPGNSRAHGYRSEVDLSAHRWTLDTPEDLFFIRSVYSELFESKDDFGTAEILDLLSRHEGLLALSTRCAELPAKG